MNPSCNLRNFKICFDYVRKCASHVRAAETHDPAPAKMVQQLDLDVGVETALEDKKYHPRNHPGVLRSRADELPDSIVKAMEVVIEAHKKADILKAGELLRQRLWGRHLPPEKKDYEEKIKLEKKFVKSILRGYDDYLAEEKSKKIEEKIVTSRLQDIIHPWHPMGISTNTCLQYLVSRTPAEFCVLHKIFSEIRSRDPDFVPLSLFDFGSGLGSGYWAVKDVWKKPLMEVFNVDTNLNMNELAYKIMSSMKGQSSPATGMFFRQFLPVTPEPTYDLVLSAFTLLELPSFNDRVKSLATLWSKADKYLIIVEDGTNAGYKAVMEARNLILHLGNELDGSGRADAKVHVFSPCPHDFVCPRFLTDNTPCNFEASYLTPAFLEGRQVRKNHRYSYVVLKRGPRPNNDSQWPRCVRESTKGGKHVHLKVCTLNGELNDVRVHKNSSCRNTYRCAKNTRWGDLLPGHIVDRPKTELNVRSKRSVD